VTICPALVAASGRGRMSAEFRVSRHASG
jgi:hypothetical protein